MDMKKHSPISDRLVLFSKYASLATIVIGGLVLGGWLFNIPALKSVFFNFSVMKANSALAFMLAGLALWIAADEKPKPAVWRAAQICSWGVLLIGLLTFCEYLFRWNPGLDQLLFRDLQTSPADFPGRMSFESAICFILVGAAAVLVHSGVSKLIHAVQYLAVTTLTISILALVGYVYGVQSLYKLGPYSSIALPTALILIILALGILCVRPDQGWIKIISMEAAGGVLLRRLLPSIFGIPTFIGLLIILGDRAGFYEARFGLAMFSVLTAGFLIIILWQNSRELNHIDADRRHSEAELRRLNLELEQRVTERTASLEDSLSFTNSLYQVAQSVVSSESLAEVMKSIVESVAATISADRTTIITFNHETRRVIHFFGAGPGIQNVASSVPYQELMEGLSGWALRELRPAFSTKAESDPRESAAVQQRRRETNCGCIVVFPLLYLDEALGTMTVINTPDQPDFTEHQVEWMQAIANQAASAIGRVRIYDQLKQASLLSETQRERLQRELFDRKLAESALAFERDLLQALMDNIPDTIYFKDTDSRFTRINRAQADVLGVDTPESAIGKTDADYFQEPELVEGFYKEEQQLIKRSEPLIDREEYNPTREGKPRWFSATKVPVKNASGEVTGLVGISRDITTDKLKDKALERQNEMLSRLHQITLDLLKYIEIDQLLDALVNMTADFLDAPYAEIMLLENDTLIVQAATPNQKHLIGGRVGRGEAVLSWQAFDTHLPAVLRDYTNWEQHHRVYDDFTLHAVADFPVLNNELCIGVLAFGRDQPEYEFTKDQIQHGLLLANLTGLVLQNARLREALREQSIRDPLTGLFNRRYMEESLQQEISRVIRQLHPVSIIMLDIDHFKNFNDTFGHASGDALLREFGKLLQSHVRAEDIACRYGGEEFILIMPHVTLEVALERAERLRQAAFEIHIHDGGQVYRNVTISLGAAVFPQHGKTIETVLKAADDALYRAKRAGRNRVMAAENEAK